MKITESMLRQIIREETRKLTSQVLRESNANPKKVQMLNKAMEHLELATSSDDADRRVHVVRAFEYLDAAFLADEQDRDLKLLVRQLDRIVKSPDLKDFIANLRVYISGL